MANALASLWQKIKDVIARTEKEYAFLKGLTVLSLVGTLLGAYFQNLSAYENKVATQAKDDMTAATQTLSESFTALSGAVSLQRQLVSNFYAAVPGDVYKNGDAYLTRSARAMYKDYMDAYTSLHQNYNLLARKAEIFLDWPSDLTHDAAANTTPAVDPLNMSTLGEFDFDCEKYMPHFESGKTRIPLTDKHTGKIVHFDWDSAKHHVMAIQYCFDVTHQKMTAALQWAANTAINPAEWSYMTTKEIPDLFNNTRPVDQVLRLNAFVSLAMSQIERIRVKYRPNGYWCSVPIVRGVISFVSEKLSGKQGWCTPVRTSVI